MNIRWAGFNLYLAGLVVLGLLAGGCHSAESERKKILATLRVHQEIQNDPTGSHAETVTVHKDPEIRMKIDKQAFVTGSFVKEAKVVDEMGGFVLKLQFDQQGSWLLEQYSADTRGRHFAIFSQFDEPGTNKLNAGKWLAAPRISTVITNGQLTFTPDATRDEAERIALGLNNVARILETGKEPKF